MEVSGEIAFLLCCSLKGSRYSSAIASLKPSAVPTREERKLAFAQQRTQAAHVAALNVLLRTYRTGIEAAAVAGQQWRRVVIQIFEGTAEEVRAVLGKTPDGVLLE